MIETPAITTTHEQPTAVIHLTIPRAEIQTAMGPAHAARVARTVYHGGYEGLGAAWGELDAWVEREGSKPTGELWEIYAAGPESGSDPSAWRTELNRPLAE